MGEVQEDELEEFGEVQGSEGCCVCVCGGHFGLGVGFVWVRVGLFRLVSLGLVLRREGEGLLFL